MPERINGGQALAVLGAGTLIVSLFLDWYEPGDSAWTVFELNDLVLAGLALLTLAVTVGAWLRSPRLAAAESAILYAGIGTLIIVVASLIQPPPAALHRSPESGAWLGLAGALLITAGGILARARLSVVITLRPVEAGKRTGVRVTGRPEGTMPAPEPRPSDPEGETATRPIADEERG